MGDYGIVRFDRAHKSMLPRKQEPFDIIGKLAVTYDGAVWNCCEHLFEKVTQKTYPNEMYDPEECLDNPDQAAYLAMQGDHCVGSIRVCKRWNGDAFIDDLAIDRAHRGNGVGHMLMDAAFSWARENDITRVSLETQDNNLLACRFYIKYGFELGGIDAKSYTYNAYKGETALYFYKQID